MITEAILYVASPEDSAAALLPVAGQPVGFRALIAAVRAGCRWVAVPATFQGTDLERAIAASPRARAAVVWLDGHRRAPDRTSLLLPVTAVVPAKTLQEMVKGDGTIALAGSETSAAVLAAEPTQVRALWPDLQAGRPVGDALQRMLKSAEVAVVRAPWYVNVTTARAARDAETFLYQTLGSAIDSRLDTVFHRRLSRPLTRLAIATGVTPNQVSFASLLVGLAAVWCFWRASVATAVIGLALYAVAVVLDHADGEVARLTLTESSLGEWLDVLADTVVHGLLVLAMGMTAGGRSGAVLGAGALVGVVTSALLAKTSPPGGGRGWARVLDGLGNRDGFYATLIAFILALAVAPALLLPLMMVVAVGSHAYWIARLASRASTGGSPLAR